MMFLVRGGGRCHVAGVIDVRDNDSSVLSFRPHPEHGCTPRLLRFHHGGVDFPLRLMQTVMGGRRGHACA